MVLLAAIGLIGLMNYYLYRVAAAAYPGGAVWVGILVGVLFFSVFAAMYFERRGWLRVAQ